jgi:hypothetical protein
MSRFVLRRVRAGAALLLSAPLLAQTQAPAPAATPAPTPRAGVTAAEEVTVLTLDVVAIDGKNRPVFGLTAADFEVKVSGKVQTIDFFEPPRQSAASSAGAPKEGRPDSEERIAGTTTPFEAKGAVRHVLFWVDLEQLPKRTISESANAIRKALEHPVAGRYGLAAHFGRTSARVWDSDSADALLAETDAIEAEALANADVPTSVQAIGPRIRDFESAGVESPGNYEQRKALETTLIEDLIAVEQAGGDPRVELQRISNYLASERRRVRGSVEELRRTLERFAMLGGPRHAVILSEGVERVPGFNFLARLQAEEGARVPPPPTAPRNAAATRPVFPSPNAPDAGREVGAGRFLFDSGGLLEVDDLARWLAASGVTVHFIDPGSLGRDLPTATDRFSFHSVRRAEDAKSLQETPLRYAADTGGLSRLTTNDIGAALTDFLDATTGTYRIGVRLTGVDPKKTYAVKVSTRKAGVNALARSAFKPAGAAPRAVATLAEDARHAGVAARADERRPGAARTAKKAIPVSLSWKGLSTLPSKDPAKPFWKLEVKIPHEALTFRPEEDALLASVQISVEAVALDGPARDSFTDDWFLSYTGPEYKEARDTEALRSVTLQLQPGRWELKVSVHDALGDAFGAATLRVEATR